MSSVNQSDPVAGRNGIVIKKRDYQNEVSGYRTYEVHQRERVGESTEKIKPIQLISDDYRIDPYPFLALLREHYPFYRDWLANSYWVTQYNDVTSIFADDANFESRSKAWHYGLNEFGRDLGGEIAVLNAQAASSDAQGQAIAQSIAESLAGESNIDLATGFAARFAMDLLTARYDIPVEDHAFFASAYWRMQRGTSFDPALQQDGKLAMNELVAYFTPIVAARTSAPGEDMVSAMVSLAEPATAKDVVITLLEADHETLHGALSNLWYLFLTHPEEFEKARSEPRLIKLAYLETIRHSTPMLSSNRFAKHEVERFGKLIPEGARIVCSAAAANRDPRIFNEPDRFISDRQDMCHREPRGQYRADGLASGIVFGLGKPSVHPAVPEDRPRSHYAQTRDLVVMASQALLNHFSDIRLAKDASPRLSSLTVGEMHTCWKLPVACKVR